MEVSLGLMIVNMFFDMTIGMVLGMVASPLMMKAIKSIKQRRKVSKMLREVAELQKSGQSPNQYQIV
jgi:MFS superfamily sulfate permease-like transporter